MPPAFSLYMSTIYKFSTNNFCIEKAPLEGEISAQEHSWCAAKKTHQISAITTA